MLPRVRKIGIIWATILISLGFVFIIVTIAKLYSLGDEYSSCVPIGVELNNALSMGLACTINAFIYLAALAMALWGASILLRAGLQALEATEQHEEKQ